LSNISILKNQNIEIIDNDIFKNDLLEREQSIKDLSNLIRSSNKQAFNANWGYGKTTFVKLWEKYLDKHCDVKSLYFSAWEDDFQKNH